MKLFSQILAQLRHGAVERRLTEGLARVVKACEEAGTAGTLTLVLKVAPRHSGEIHLYADIKEKAPLNPILAEPTIMFADDDGDLHRDDPRQGKLIGEDEDEQVRTLIGRAAR